MNREKKFIEGIDYYLSEEGYWVFTEKYHLERGYCCRPDNKNGCKHCPFRDKNINSDIK